jgi:non-heme chloroperoxidase
MMLPKFWPALSWPLKFLNAMVDLVSAQRDTSCNNVFGELRSTLSSDGCPIAYWEAGSHDGPPVVFLHGFLFDHHVYSAQIADPCLARGLRLIAVDIRGHGQSGRPPHACAYTDGRLWADDLNAVFSACRIERAVVVAWSFGGRMLNDFFRHYGSSRVAAVNYVAAATLADPSAIGPGHRWLADVCHEDTAIARTAESSMIETVLGLSCGTSEHTKELRALQRTSQNVRRAMRSRVLDYDELLPSLSIPFLVSHGTHDGFVLPVLAFRLRDVLKNVVVSMYESVGHAPFIEAPDRFNSELAAFASLHGA